MHRILGGACVCWPFSLSLIMPNEHAGTRKRRNPEAASALNSLENGIRRLQPSGVRKIAVIDRRFGEQVKSTRTGCCLGLMRKS